MQHSYKVFYVQVLVLSGNITHDREKLGSIVTFLTRQCRSHNMSPRNPSNAFAIRILCLKNKIQEVTNWSVSGDPKRSSSGEISTFPTITDFPRAWKVLVTWFLAVRAEQLCTGEVVQAKAVPAEGCWGRGSFTAACPEPRSAAPLHHASSDLTALPC